MPCDGVGGEAFCAARRADCAPDRAPVDLERDFAGRFCFAGRFRFGLGGSQIPLFESAKKWCVPNVNCAKTDR